MSNLTLENINISLAQLFLFFFIREAEVRLYLCVNLFASEALIELFLAIQSSAPPRGMYYSR